MTSIDEVPTHHNLEPNLQAGALRVTDVVVEPNVFRQLRTKQNMSLDTLASKIHISKQALIRLEQGTFPRPLPTVLDWWVKNYGYSELTIVEAYEGYRERQRKVHRHLFGQTLSVDPFLNVHPFRQLRGNLNPSEVAKALCIPQATIQHFERKWKTQQSVPRELVAALLETGYGRQVYEFSNDYLRWRNRMLGRG